MYTHAIFECHTLYIKNSHLLKSFDSFQEMLKLTLYFVQLDNLYFSFFFLIWYVILDFVTV